MSTTTITDLTVADTEGLDTVVRMCMQTVLETVPEFAGNAERAHETLKNFTFTQMRAMIADDLGDPKRRAIVASDLEGRVRGYCIVSVKEDDSGHRYGYVFSCGVDRDYRRRGIASQLLDEAERWFRAMAATYIRAETHVTNLATQNLFKNHGFTMAGPMHRKWSSYALRKPLTTTQANRGA